jgi:hypothetical protein
MGRRVGLGWGLMGRTRGACYSAQLVLVCAAMRLECVVMKMQQRARCIGTDPIEQVLGCIARVWFDSTQMNSSAAGCLSSFCV